MLKLEIDHRRGEPEVLTLRLTATPSLEALADPARHPLLAWTRGTPWEPWGRLMAFWMTPMVPVVTVTGTPPRTIDSRDYRVVGPDAAP